MTDEKDKDGNLLPDNVRLTKFGKILRSTSLDELPELINILKGDMSFVGPRPLLVEYLPLYNEEQKHRHDVRPGLTGLAQINGRNNLEWSRRFEMDLEYIEKMSLRFDLAIMFNTFKKVFKKGETLDGDVVLMHDIQNSTPDAVKDICKYLSKKGYQMVTISEMAYYKGYKLEGGKAYYEFYDKNNAE